MHKFYLSLAINAYSWVVLYLQTFDHIYIEFFKFVLSSLFCPSRIKLRRRTCAYDYKSNQNVVTWLKANA